jgi:hypothetical protein
MVCREKPSALLIKDTTRDKAFVSARISAMHAIRLHEYWLEGSTGGGSKNNPP